MKKQCKNLVLALAAFCIISIASCTTANAVATCCDNMRISSYTKSVRVDTTPCPYHVGCTEITYKVYKHRYCTNCHADHGDVYLRTEVKHTSIDEA